MTFIHSVGRYDTAEKACEIAERWEKELHIVEVRIHKARKYYYVLVKVDIDSIKNEDNAPFEENPFN